VLAHVSSLPGPAHAGDFGPASTRFLDWCHTSGLRLWQVLPLGPPGPGHSPFASSSAFACNPSWYSGRTGAGDSGEHGDRSDLASAAIDRRQRLEEAWIRFQRDADGDERRNFTAYCKDADRAAWLPDWTLYSALKEHHGGRPWFEWDTELRRRDAVALRAASRQFAERVQFHAWVQFALDGEARAVRTAAEERDIVWLGDLPFYVALDSADVWSRRELFRVDPDGRPGAIAGVPPDDFSATGQRWDQPVFDWKAMADDGFEWWLVRCRAALCRVHALRLDHFRGYSACWEIPPGAETAATGRWVDGPADALLRSVRDAGLDDRLVAEDLGEITRDVIDLRERFGLPGMHVLQFGLDDRESTHHPERHSERALACTGTHDNDTFNGWFAELDAATRARVSDALGSSETPARSAIEVCWGSPANWAIAPLQDMLELGGAARMNLPGQPAGQWTWRAGSFELTAERSGWLKRLSRLHRRV